MADLVSAQSGNWLTASTWNVVEHSGGGTTTFVDAGTSYTYSPTFTIANGVVIQGVILIMSRFGLNSGTFTIAISDDNGVTATREITVNSTDVLVTSSRWTYFKFASTLTADGGSDYRIGFKRTSGADIRFLRSSTAADVARRVVGSTTQAPAAGDFLWAIGNRTGAATLNSLTVTMNETALTAYAGMVVSDGGTVSFDTSTNTQLQMGTSSLVVDAGGTLNIGTSGSPIPRAQTAVLEFLNASDGASTLQVEDGGVLNCYGQSRTSGKDVVHCKLNTDEAAAQTVLGVDTDTGWKNGDEIAISSTTQTASQHEQRTLSGDAGASSITVSSGLTNAHSGTSPTQAEVVLLTRNVQIRSSSSTNMTHVRVQSGGIMNAEWLDLRYCGHGTGTGNCAVRIESTETCTFRYCVARNGEAYGWATTVNVTGFSLQDSTVYDCIKTNTSAGLYIENGHTGYTVRNFIVMGGGASVANTYGYRVRHIDSTCVLENITCCSGAFGTGGVGFWPDVQASHQYWTVDGFSFHSNSAASGGTIFSTNPLVGVTFKNGSIWYNNTMGVFIDGAIYADVLFENVKVFGNATAGFDIRNESSPVRWTLRSCTFAGTSAHAQPRGIWVNSTNSCSLMDWLMESCTFGEATGIFVAHSTADLVWATGTHITTMKLVNCKLASTTELSNYTVAGGQQRGSYIASQQHDQALDNKVYTPYGTLAYETGTVEVSPAMKLTPLSASVKLQSNGEVRGRGFMVPINSGATRTITVRARKDGSYNGNQPRLVVKANPAVGITSDTVLDTLSVGANTWETLSGVTAAATAAGIIECIVDCDGTAGNAFIDSWSG